MTNQEINEAIAKELGWQFEDISSDSNPEDRTNWHKRAANGCLQMLSRLPDFATDLRAIYDAEWELSQEEHERFVVELRRIAGRDYTGIPTPEFSVVSACARQRTEAFLRVKGIWKEEP